MVAGYGDPAANGGADEIRAGIDEAGEASIVLKAKVLEKEELGAADDGFVHPLDCSCESIDQTDPPDCPRLAEAMVDLGLENIDDLIGPRNIGKQGDNW